MGTIGRCDNIFLNVSESETVFYDQAKEWSCSLLGMLLVDVRGHFKAFRLFAIYWFRE